jgi:hypothetical protein
MQGTRPGSREAAFGKHSAPDAQSRVKSGLRQSWHIIKSMDPNSGPAAAYARRICSAWKGFLSTCTPEEGDKMRPSLEKFIKEAFSAISHCRNEEVATQIIASLSTLIDFAPSEVFAQLVSLCVTRKPDSTSYVSSAYLIDSVEAISMVGKGNVWVYCAIEHFAMEIETEAAAGQQTQLQLNPELAVFMGVASTRIMDDSGIISGKSCMVPQNFISTIAYGFLFGAGYDISVRLSAMDAVPEMFGRQEQTAIFSRLHNLGMSLPVLIEQKSSFDVLPVSGDDPLLYALEGERIILETKRVDVIARKQMLSCARKHLNDLGMAAVFPGAPFNTLQ